MHCWCIIDALLIHYWYTLLMYYWYIVDVLPMHMWCTAMYYWCSFILMIDVLLIHCWCIADALLIHIIDVLWCINIASLMHYWCLFDALLVHMIDWWLIHYWCITNAFVKQYWCIVGVLLIIVDTHYRCYISLICNISYVYQRWTIDVLLKHSWCIIDALLMFYLYIIDTPL